MTFISGIASGTLGTLLLGLLGVILGTRRTSTQNTELQLLEDAGKLLAHHLAPLVAAIDRHGVTLQRHTRILATTPPAAAPTMPPAPSTPAPTPAPGTIPAPATTTPATS